MTDSDKIAQWLEIILFERFGHKFSVKYFDEKMIVSLEGNNKKIEFIQLIDDFYQIKKSDEIPCCYFNAKREEFLCPVDSLIPQPGLATPTLRLLDRRGDGAVVSYDILGLTYWMLSRQEEVGAEKLDEHGRFSAFSSHAFLNNYLERPLVDEWLIILGQIFQLVWNDLPLKKHRFSMKVSHDVDRPSRYGFVSFPQMIRKIAGSIIVHKDFSSIFHAPFIWYLSRKRLLDTDPYNTFQWLMDLSDECQMTSAFYFICGGQNKYDADYTIADPSIRELLFAIHSRGHEIGLHPSYDTYQDEESLIAEANYLRNTCAELGVKQEEFGGRMHYLRWEPRTFMLWETAGMSYDSTLSYADHPGFRCGTCFEYTAIDPYTKKTLQLRVRPLIVMECSIGSYLGLGYGDEMLEHVNKLKDKCRKVNGCFTLLWHNSEFDVEQRALYEKIMR